MKKVYRILPVSTFDMPGREQWLEEEPLTTHLGLFGYDTRFSVEENQALRRFSLLSPTWYEVSQSGYGLQTGTQANSYSSDPENGTYRYAPSAVYIPVSIRSAFPILETCPRSVTDWLFVLYAAGVAITLAWYFLSYLRLRLILRRMGRALTRQQWALTAPDHPPLKGRIWLPTASALPYYSRRSFLQSCTAEKPGESRKDLPESCSADFTAAIGRWR